MQGPKAVHNSPPTRRGTSTAEAALLDGVDCWAGTSRMEVAPSSRGSTALCSEDRNIISPFNVAIAANRQYYVKTSSRVFAVSPKFEIPKEYGNHAHTKLKNHLVEGKPFMQNSFI